MKRKHLSQKALAEAVGTGQSTVQGWLGGRSLPGGEFLVVMPDTLGISGHWLLTGQGPMEPPGETARLGHLFAAGYNVALADVRRAIDKLGPVEFAPAVSTDSEALAAEVKLRLKDLDKRPPAEAPSTKRERRKRPS